MNYLRDTISIPRYYVIVTAVVGVIIGAVI